MAEQIYWLWYSLRTQHIPPRTAESCLKRFGGPKQIYEMTTEELKAQLPPRLAGQLIRKDMGPCRQIQNVCREKGIDILTWDDRAYPQRLRQIPQPPMVLYIRGQLPDLTLAITMVGTRHCTDYGRKVTADLAGKLAKAGCTVVSGMALGIDGIANGAALDAGGKTVAVLGCGADICYPSTHRALMEQIIRNGAIITEYPPGSSPKREHFPARNRIMSGLSLGTVVVEAPARSGSLITARYAAEQGRDVFAVPGNIYASESQGCLHLLRDGAHLAASAQDILQHYEGLLRQELKQEILKENLQRPEKGSKIRDDAGKKFRDSVMQEEKNPKQEKAPDISGLSREERAVYEAVVQGADRPDLIIENTELPASRVMAAVTMMEISGLIKREGGRIFLDL